MAKKRGTPQILIFFVGSYNKNATPARTTVTVRTFRGEHLHLQTSKANEADAVWPSSSSHDQHYSAFREGKKTLSLHPLMS